MKHSQKIFKVLTATTIFFILIFTKTADAQNQEWVKTYTNLNNGTNVVNDMVIDGNHDIYVTGNSKGNGTENDFCTIKYNPDGTQQWVKRYSNNMNDYSKAITSDYNNNVYVAGSCKNDAVTGDDICVIKYNSTGTALWTVKYTSTGNKKDYANAIWVDNQQNVYVTGCTEVSGNHGKAILIKYNSAGVKQWEKIEENNNPDYMAEGFGLIGDGAGNIYISGTSGHNAILIKFSAAGSRLWIKYYTSIEYSCFRYINKDLQGNIITAGYVGTESNSDYVTAKYTSDGSNPWMHFHNGTEDDQDQINSLTVDYNGNIYVTGATNLASTKTCTTIKYSNTGQKLWTADYNGGQGLTDIGHALTFDGQGNIFVTGQTSPSWYKSEMMTIKYNSAGAEQWVTKYSGIDSIDIGNSIAVDNGTLIVAGTSYINNTANFLTIKYSALSGIQHIGGEIPADYKLSQNYPNPFNPVTNINFSLPKSGYVELTVFDITGKEVVSLVNEQLNAGTYKYDFDASQLSSGAYFYRLTAADFTEVKKMMLVK